MKWMANLDIEIEVLFKKDIMFVWWLSKWLICKSYSVDCEKIYIYSCNKTKPSITVLKSGIKFIDRLEMMVANSCNKFAIHFEK